MKADVAGIAVSTAHFIGGKRLASKRTFPVRSPIDGRHLAEVSAGGTEEVAAAVSAARAAFPRWAALGPKGRHPILKRFAQKIRDHLPEIAAVETADNGSLLTGNLARVVPRAALNIEFFADWALKLGAETIDSPEVVNHVRFDPSGVAALITPWNAPFMLTTWKVGPAIAAGNAVVVKPPEWAPLTCSLMADIATEAGVPPGVLNVVQGVGEEAGAALAAHPDVDRLSFTGSTDTAKLIGQSTARSLTPVSFELGGKSPYIVCADADLDAAAQTAAAQYLNAGQVCLAGTRILVDAEVAEPFQTKLRAAAAHMTVGDPRDKATRVGPLITPEHFARVEGFVERAFQARRQAAVGRTSRQGGRAVLRADASRWCPTRSGDRATRGVRPRAHLANLSRRGRGDRARQRYALRARRDDLQQERGARHAPRPSRRRRHRVGELLLRARAGGALRRQPRLRHRSRGRELELRLLLRREEHRGAEGIFCLRRGTMSVLDGAREEWRRILHEGQPKWVKPEGEVLRLGDGRQLAERDAVYLPPCDPTKILCIHLNYESRRVEFRAPQLETPTYFQKPTTALNAHRGTLMRPAGHKYLNYEGEIAVIIGKPMRNVGRDEAWDSIAGFAPANDVGCQDYRETDAGSMLRVKGQDGFCPIGPGIVRGVDVRKATVRTYLNGEYGAGGSRHGDDLPDRLHPGRPVAVHYACCRATSFFPVRRRTRGR